MDKEQFKVQFLKDVSNHELKLIRSDGVNRHLRFRQPDTSNMYFDLVTWPGVLCYTGDMGTYVFSRVEDMFQFFRGDHDRDGNLNLKINPGYWSEKVLAQDRDGVQEYSPELFKENIVRWCGEHDIDDHDRAALMRDVDCQVLAYAQEEWEARDAARRFTFNDELVFQDFWEVNCKVFTHRFRWCCYAMVWGIDQFDRLGQVKV